MSSSLHAPSFLELESSFRSIMPSGHGVGSSQMFVTSPPFDHSRARNAALGHQHIFYAPFHSSSPCSNTNVVSPGPFTWDNRLAGLPLADIGPPSPFSRPTHQLPCLEKRRTTNRSRKTVRFSLQQQVFTVPNDDEEPREWLKPEDLDRQRNIDKRIGNIVAQDEDYKNAIHFLLKSFKAEHYVGRQQLLDQVRVLLTQPEARGLEHRIVSLLKSKRIKAVHQFLKHQHNLQSQERSKILRALKLRQVSLKLSRGARQLAFRLAQSDRLAAKAIHEDR